MKINDIAVNASEFTDAGHLWLLLIINLAAFNKIKCKVYFIFMLLNRNNKLVSPLLNRNKTAEMKNDYSSRYKQ